MTEYTFQAEIHQLMNLIINAFYSNKEIFLRELVSNAADALDKAKYAFFENHSGTSQPSYKIRLKLDKERNVLQISDNGIGMSRDDMVANLGTIARSGTKAFMESLKDKGDLNLIGQFGVGFYSAFLVADKVQVYSRKAGEWNVWESDAGDKFTITTLESPEGLDVEFGDSVSETHIFLHMKDTEFLEESKIREILRTHNSFIVYPIELQVKRTREEPVDPAPVDSSATPVDSSATPVDSSATPVDTVEDVVIEDDDEDPKPPKTKTVEYLEWEHVNKDQPVWMRKPEDIEDSEYMAVYRNISGELHKYSGLKHISGEGAVNFKGILFTPARPQRNLYDSIKKKCTIKLYAKKVFISDQCSDLLPEWLEFMYGVVDCEDLPLNVSRELLQGNRAIKTIGKNIVKKSIELIGEIMKKDDKDSADFYKNFGRSLKFGVNSDHTHREKLMDFLRFDSTKAEGEKLRSLQDYVDSMQDSQDSIYYITGESKDMIIGSPFLDAVESKGYEVLYMTDAIDEYVMQQVPAYKEKKFVNITRAGFKLPGDSEDSEVWAETVKSLEATCKFMKETLGPKVDKVIVSKNLTGSSPCTIANPENGLTANMERIARAQALKNSQFMRVSKVMEINAGHPIVQELRSRIDNPKDSDKKSEKDIVKLMYEISSVSSGFALEKPQEFVKRVFHMIQAGICDDTEETVDITTGVETESGVETEMESVD